MSHLSRKAIDLAKQFITAERNLVKPDVATSVVAVSSKELAALPVANVTACDEHAAVLTTMRFVEVDWIKRYSYWMVSR